VTADHATELGEDVGIVAVGADEQGRFHAGEPQAGVVGTAGGKIEQRDREGIAAQRRQSDGDVRHDLPAIGHRTGRGEHREHARERQARGPRRGSGCRAIIERAREEDDQGVVGDGGGEIGGRRV